MRLVFVAAAVASFLLPACTDDYEQAAVTASPDGTFRVLYYPCPSGRAPDTIQLLTDFDVVIGDEDDTVLWEAKATASTRPPTDVEMFGPGSLPPTYSETVALREPKRGDEVAVYMTIGAGDFALSFTWGSLEEGVLLTDEDSPKTYAAWVDYARDGCFGGT